MQIPSPPSHHTLKACASRIKFRPWNPRKTRCISRAANHYIVHNVRTAVFSSSGTRTRRSSFIRVARIINSTIRLHFALRHPFCTINTASLNRWYHVCTLYPRYILCTQSTRVTAAQLQGSAFPYLDMDCGTLNAPKFKPEHLATPPRYNPRSRSDCTLIPAQTTRP